MRNYCEILFLLLFLSGCGKNIPHAGGKKTEIITVCDDFKAIQEELETILEKKIYTPTEECIFTIYSVSPDDFLRYNKRRNVMVIGTLGESLIDSLLSEGAKKKVKSKEGFVFGEENLFINGQSVLIVASPEKSLLKDIIEENEKIIFGYFVSGVRKRLREGLYKDGFQKDLYERLLLEHGFSLKVPLGWVVARDTNQFFEIIRHNPDRIISIYWEYKPKGKITYSEAVRIRNDIAKKWLEEDCVDTEKTQIHATDFHDILCQKLTGIWQNDEKVMGGPFRTYIISTKDRFYFLDMHIFAPGEKKWLWQEQLEFIVDTIEL
jgi:hypothetical protein